MNSATMRAVVVSAAVLGVAAVFPSAAQAQGTSYQVKKGDSLLRIAGKTKPKGASTTQMFVAIVKANGDALKGGVHVLKPGQTLMIPDAAQVNAITAADARKEMASILDKAPLSIPGAPTASIRPTPQLAPDAAERRYTEGLAFEKSGNHQDALNAFLDAGGNGHGLAQKKLGELYGRGTPAAKRDYQTSLQWYQKARAQGVEIPEPFQQRTTPSSR